LSVSGQCCEDFIWCEEVEHLAGPVIQPFGDVVAIVLAVAAEVAFPVAGFEATPAFAQDYPQKL
jgi:hypothetical protein